jgi:hypothetical protein
VKSLAPTLLLLSACTPAVSVLTPSRGAMLDAGEDVSVLVQISRGAATVDGEPADEVGGGLWSATVPEVAGLGVLQAAVAGTDALELRSWHQGSFHEPGAAQPGALQLSLSPEALCEGEPSLCWLVEDLLTGQDLAAFVDNPLDVSGVEVTVESAVAEVVSVQLEPGASSAVSIALEGLVAAYTADAFVYQSSGTASFERVDIQGTLGFEGAVAALEVGTVEASDPVVEDEGLLPSSVIDLLAAALQAELEDAMADATATATEQVVVELLAQAGPLPSVDFERPLEAQATAAEVLPSEAGFAVSYDASIRAESPAVAQDSQGLMVGSQAAAVPGGSPLTVALGAPVVNALAYAAWDAGNFEGLVFTREELEAAGMPALAFPYDQLQQAEIELLLPPLLAWRDDGPWLDLGGISADLSVQASRDAGLSTAAHLPVRLVQGDGGLLLQLDPERAVQLEAIGFDELNELADPEQAAILVESAAPAVLERVFGELPAVTLPSLAFTRLDGGAGPVLSLDFESLEQVDDHWRLSLGWSAGR